MQEPRSRALPERSTMRRPIPFRERIEFGPVAAITNTRVIL
jgi:hypothetical protein